MSRGTPSPLAGDEPLLDAEPDFGWLDLAGIGAFALGLSGVFAAGAIFGAGL